MWEFIAWDMFTFDRYSNKFSKDLFEPYFADFGTVAIEAIAKFLDINI
jgi:hypothetical protein